MRTFIRDSPAACRDVFSTVTRCWKKQHKDRSVPQDRWPRCAVQSDISCNDAVYDFRQNKQKINEIEVRAVLFFKNRWGSAVLSLTHLQDDVTASHTNTQPQCSNHFTPYSLKTTEEEEGERSELKTGQSWELQKAQNRDWKADMWGESVGSLLNICSWNLSSLLSFGRIKKRESNTYNTETCKWRGSCVLHQQPHVHTLHVISHIIISHCLLKVSDCKLERHLWPVLHLKAPGCVNI